ncbi:hypothetical protein HMPREF9080_01716 [Cardiobacterium valvarum F0432]|uniref:Uncharacterized protein n=1 Tax=Cardiobacterium valvarum F0432 TaxID=797473 RepID=G9ZG16_9GAMM|nr:hypothetical protein HMPREF9080_01716 [Cardiobacterium valvarum F0432]
MLLVAAKPPLRVFFFDAEMVILLLIISHCMNILAEKLLVWLFVNH